MAHLRSIALTVDEGDLGCFTWLLMESLGDAIVFDIHLASAETPEPTCGAALHAGYQALLKLVKDDPINGPRAGGEDENADPVGSDLDNAPSICR
jgi:hypothetical protein